MHCVRSALDHLIWELSVEHQPSPPPPNPLPNGSPWKRAGFPICQSEKGWSGRDTPGLALIDPALVSLVRDAQPFVTAPHAPEREPLAVLQELWNIDKHRHLHLVSATVELDEVLPGVLGPGLRDVELNIISKRPAGPVSGPTEIGRVRTVPRLRVPQLHVNPRVAVDVAFDAGPPASGRRVNDTLSEIGRTVESIVARF